MMSWEDCWFLGPTGAQGVSWVVGAYLCEERLRTEAADGEMGELGGT